jgi:hypothetical protein
MTVEVVVIYYSSTGTVHAFAVRLNGVPLGAGKS